MSSLDLYSVVSPSIAVFIESLLPIRASKDFSVPDKVLKAVLNQVIQDDAINFEKNEKAICSAIIREIKSGGRISGKRILETAKSTDFDWGLYDRCVWLCENHNIIDSNFRYIAEPPCLPVDDKESLSALKVNEIKAILKSNGHSISGTRDELVNRLWQFLPIKDTEKALADQYKANLLVYKPKYLALKYQSLAHFILQRAYFVMQIIRYTDKKDNPFIGKFSPKLMELGSNGDKELAKLVDGSGYSGVITGNVIYKFLPIFPNDLASINFQYQR